MSLNEWEPISKEVQSRDALLISLAGGTIGIIGAIATERILSGQQIDVNAAVKAVVLTVFGAGLTVGGVTKRLDLRRSPKNGRE